MKTFLIFFYSSWIVRYWRTITILIKRAKLSPSAIIIGSIDNFHIGKKSTINGKTIINIINNGQFRIGSHSWCANDISIETDEYIEVGNMTTIQRRCTINGNVTIGNNCLLAPNVFISSSTHPFRLKPHLTIREQEKLTDHDQVNKPIWIQDDCWLGTNVVICPGITIGKGSIIGANSVVTKDVLPYSVIAGLPGKKIGERLKWTPPCSIKPSEESYIYVLSGQLINCDDNEKGFLFDTHQSLIVVVSDQVNNIDIHFKNTGIKKVNIGSSKITLDIINSKITIDTHHMKKIYGGHMIEISLYDKSPNYGIVSDLINRTS